MQKLKSLVLCSVLLVSGCAANAEPEIRYNTTSTPGQAISPAPSATPVQTPFYAAEIRSANETAEAFSNIDNGGFAATDGQNIYIATDKLYIMDMYCRQSTVLLDSPDICYLNIYGDYLYFVNAADYGVYRLTKDGKELLRLPVTGAFNLVAADNSLFYQNAVGETSDNLLYKCDLLGRNIECLNITAGNLCAGQTGLYFSNKDDNGYLYKYSFDEKAVVKVRSDSVKQITIAGGNIYYIAANENNQIISINSTGSGRKIIVDEPCRYLNHIGTSLVFSTENSGVIEKISAEGKGRGIVLAAEEAHAFNVAGDYIFFESFPLPSMDAVTYRIRPDGTGLYPDFPEQSLALIHDFDIETMTVALDYVELLTGDDAVQAYSYDSGLSDKKAATIVQNDLNGVYLRNKSPKIRELRLTNYTSITLVARQDGSLDIAGYSASGNDFASLYQSNCELCKDLLYYVTAADDEIISIQQQYNSDIVK